MHLSRLIALAGLLAFTFEPAAAQDAAKDFPSRSLRVVVPFPAGGPSDVLARLIGQKMSEDCRVGPGYFTPSPSQIRT